MRSSRSNPFAIDSVTVYPERVYLAGISVESFKQEAKQPLKAQITEDKPKTVSVEVKQQMQEKAKQDAILSLFVYKPRQTGFGHVAEMTAAAINNPETTTIAVLEPGDDTTADDRIQRQDVLDVLSNTNASIYTDLDEAVSHVNQLTDDGLEVPVSFNAEEQV